MFGSCCLPIAMCFSGWRFKISQIYLRLIQTGGWNGHASSLDLNLIIFSQFDLHHTSSIRHYCWKKAAERKGIEHDFKL